MCSDHRLFGRPPPLPAAFCFLTHRLVTPFHTLLGIHDLINVRDAIDKERFTETLVVVPATLEAAVPQVSVLWFKLGPRLVEFDIPLVQSLGVVETKVVQVLDHEQSFGSGEKISAQEKDCIQQISATLGLSESELTAEILSELEQQA